MRGYETISKPLTKLLKKDAFVWGTEAQEAFDELKEAMMTTPTLALPDLTKPFVVETYVSGVGMGAILMSEGHPIAFANKALSEKHLSLSVYDKELMFVVHVMEMWKHYLIG